MRYTILSAAILAMLTCSTASNAQDNEEKKPKKDHSHDVLTISNKGIEITTSDSTQKAADSVKNSKKIIKMQYGMLDLGFNRLIDNTNYSDPYVMSYMNVPLAQQNADLFNLKNGKSVNVNIYPWMMRLQAVRTPGQRIYFTTGLGLQVYNFRFEENITFTKKPDVGMDTISFSKNKLAINYLNIPLMVTFKTRIHKDSKGRHKKDTWLVYGAGITEGYRMGAWTKQMSKERGKVKVRDEFGLADFNTCVTAEFGVEGIFRFFASYQLTSIYDKGFEQRPVTIGLRFNGI